MTLKKQSKKIMILDYGMGNLMSVKSALNTLGADSFVSNEVASLNKADAYVLPGVGAFGEAMKNLLDLRVVDNLTEEILIKRKPILGICLGMQILFQSSEENGFHKGLGWLPGVVKKLSLEDSFRLPHVGWNNIEINFAEPLFDNYKLKSSYYFDHSYHVICDQNLVVASCDYGIKFNAAIRKNNILATQFHPEKSQNAGLRLLRSFLNFVE
jgi:imidazole glycerol-phosphate synthase subunit HisH